MTARTIIEQLAKQGEVEFFSCASDPLGQRTFRVRDKPLGYDIGWAVKRLQEKQRVRRSGWNGKGMWLILSEPDPIRTYSYGPETHRMPPYVVMRAADETFVPWLCSQTDLLARDWELA